MCVANFQCDDLLVQLSDLLPELGDLRLIGPASRLQWSLLREANATDPRENETQREPLDQPLNPIHWCFLAQEVTPNRNRTPRFHFVFRPWLFSVPRQPAVIRCVP